MTIPDHLIIGASGLDAFANSSSDISGPGHVPGLLWPHRFSDGREQTPALGPRAFLIGDALKPALVRMLFPLQRKLVNGFRSSVPKSQNE